MIEKLHKLYKEFVALGLDGYSERIIRLASEGTHVVRPGDNYVKIMKLYCGIDYDEDFLRRLQALNKDIDPSRLQPGMTVRIPEATVRPNMNKNPSEEIKSFIKGYEKLKLKAYNDGSGNMTIGWGHNCEYGGCPTDLNTPITESQATALFNSDMKIASDFIKKYVLTPLSDKQFDVLVSLAFNMGKNKLNNTGLINTINSGIANRESLISQKIRDLAVDENGNPFPNQEGLVDRRAAEARMFFS